jgi:hypothetical protein
VTPAAPADDAWNNLRARLTHVWSVRLILDTWSPDSK